MRESREATHETRRVRGPADAEQLPASGEEDWQTEFHVYAVEWTEDRLDFFLDDELYFSRSSADVLLPTAPMYLILNQAVSSYLFPPSPTHGNYPATMSVDYIRVFQLKK